MNNDDIKELGRLNFEDMLWVIFIFLSIMNIVSNGCQKEYVKTRIEYYEDRANNISICVLIILFYIYIYFFLRNYSMYNGKKNPNDYDLVKVIGSMLFVLGTLCLLYFQLNSDDNFIGGVTL